MRPDDGGSLTDRDRPAAARGRKKPPAKSARTHAAPGDERSVAEEARESAGQLGAAAERLRQGMEELRTLAEARPVREEVRQVAEATRGAVEDLRQLADQVRALTEEMRRAGRTGQAGDEQRSSRAEMPVTAREIERRKHRGGSTTAMSAPADEPRERVEHRAEPVAQPPEKPNTALEQSLQVLERWAEGLRERLKRPGQESGPDQGRSVPGGP